MNKLFLGALALVLVGGGCLGAAGGSDVAQDDWFLSFDMPEGFVMTAPYVDGGTPVLLEVDRDMGEIYVQSSSKHQIWGGAAPEPEDIAKIGEVESENMMKISVRLLDERRIVPSEATDLGDGFFINEFCEDETDCQLGGLLNDEYYLVTPENNFLFRVNLRSDEYDQELAEEIIMSAQVVELVEEEA
jgi:hypothetical protein